VLFGEGDCGVEFFGAGARADGQDGADACFDRAGQHGRAVFVELGEVDVSVGVD
jgi:hypothetical protein